MNYTIQQISASLEAAYYHLRQMTEFVFEWNGKVQEAQRELAASKHAIILAHAEDPKKLGANEAARNAAIDDLTRDQRENVLRCEAVLSGHRHNVELARLEVEHWRAQLRCAEVASVALGALAEA